MSLKQKKPLLRSSAKIDDIFAYTGVLGNSAKDLKKLLGNAKIHKNSKFVNIKLRDTFIRNTSRFLSAGMDISDGLFSDMQKISTSSRLGFKFLHKIKNTAACSGEEYEMLVSFSPRQRKTMIRRAVVSRTPLTLFAVGKRITYTNRCKSHHFKR